MSERENDVFDGAAEAFLDHMTTVRYYIREQLGRCNLVNYLPSTPSTSVDIGGGIGRDALWLAEMGHAAYLVEPNPTLYRLSEDLRVARPRKFTDNLVMFNGTDADFLHRVGPSGFDIVLSHGVMMYQTNPEEHLINLSLLAKPGSILSLMTKGYDGLYAKLVSQGDIETANQLRKTGQIDRNNLGKPITAYKPEQLTSMLEAAGFDVLDWNGIRILNDEDHQPISSFTDRQLDALVDAELEAGSDPVLRYKGQMLQFIARRRF